MTEYGPIGVEHLTNKRVNLYTIKDMVDDLYMTSMRRVLYIVLPLEDFRMVSLQASQYMFPFPEGAHLRQLYGMYISVDSRLPLGDVLLLYEDK